jgi:hypothetical protein
MIIIGKSRILILPFHKRMQELIFGKVALELYEEKMAGTALSKMIPNPEIQGGK